MGGEAPDGRGEPAGPGAVPPPAAPAPRRRLRSLGRKLLLALAAFALTWLVLELVARSFLDRWAPVRLRDGIYVNSLPLATGLTGPVFRGVKEGEPLPQEKPEGQLRIAVFGESSVEGSPFGLSASPPTMLHDLLREAWPERDVVVMNMGLAASIATNTYYHLLLATRYDPDVIIFYLGINDDERMPGEQCLAASHPLLHGLWRFGVEHSWLLWTTRALGPPLVWESREAGVSNWEPEDCPAEPFPLWADLLVGVAVDSGARVIVTTPVRSAAAQVEPRDWPAGRRLELEGLPEDYRRLLACRLTPGCDFPGALAAALQAVADEDGGPPPWLQVPGLWRPPTHLDEHGARLDALRDAWQAAAARHGATFVDFRAALAAAHPGGLMADTYFVDEIHLSPDGYSFLARHWREQLRPLFGSDPPGQPAFPRPAEVRHYLAGTDLGSRMYASYLKRGWILTVLPGIELAATFEQGPAAEWARLTLGWLREGAGLPSGLSPDRAARLADFDPTTPPERPEDGARPEL